MSPLFSRDQARELMRARNIPEAMIERALAREFGPGDSAPAPQPLATAFPIRLVLPWSTLCSDNDKYGAVARKNGSTTYPKLILTERYRLAKSSARKLALTVMHGADPVRTPLALRARVWVPDNRPGHDVCNFAKCALDALQGAIYANDEQLHRVTWERAGVDVDAPRAELEVTPL